MLFIKWTNPGINKRFYEILAILNSKGIKRYHFHPICPKLKDNKSALKSIQSNLLRRWFKYSTHGCSEYFTRKPFKLRLRASYANLRGRLRFFAFKSWLTVVISVLTQFLNSGSGILKLLNLKGYQFFEFDFE